MRFTNYISHFHSLNIPSEKPSQSHIKISQWICETDRGVCIRRGMDDWYLYFFWMWNHWTFPFIFNQNEVCVLIINLLFLNGLAIFFFHSLSCKLVSKSPFSFLSLTKFCTAWSFVTIRHFCLISCYFWLLTFSLLFFRGYIQFTRIPQRSEREREEERESALKDRCPTNSLDILM